ncbi:MAG: hypothetical protein PF961_09130 [Planctomycetota bacterium]|nr:hypothetical protein [Planctomycetota bacterium]
MSDEDKIIAFPGVGDAGDQEQARGEEDISVPGTGTVGIPGLTADQEKAVQIVLSGMSFVCVGIKAAGDGADFFTAIHGKREDLREAGPHLGGVIDRAFERRDVD